MERREIALRKDKNLIKIIFSIEFSSSMSFLSFYLSHNHHRHSAVSRLIIEWLSYNCQDFIIFKFAHYSTFNAICTRTMEAIFNCSEISLSRHWIKVYTQQCQNESNFFCTHTHKIATGSFLIFSLFLSSLYF